jgi:tetratricopeptide (TPR) repeat protein
MDYYPVRPNDPNTLFATALLYSQIDDWPNALKLIEKVNPRLRTPTIAEFQRAAWMEVQLIYAVEFARKGSTSQSISVFSRAEAVADKDPILLGKISRAYIDAGMTDKGINLLRQKVSVPAGAPTDLLIEYGNILLKTNHVR